MVFFLLSGYVIQYSVDRRPDISAGEFLWRRFLRLYPLILLALVVSYVTACVARGGVEDPRIVQALANLFSLQDFSPVKPGAWSDVYWGNAPLWSLSYECWFYVLFACLRWRVPESRRTTVAGAISLIGALVLFLWPTAPAYWAAYFVIWWMGCALAAGESPGREGERWRAWRWLLATFALVLAGSGTRWMTEGGGMQAGVYPLLIARHFVIAVALATAVLVAGKRLAGGVAIAMSPFAAVASWSYGLYVLHFPIAANELWLPATLPRGWAVAIYAATALVVSWWGECRYQPWMRARLVRWADRRARSVLTGVPVNAASTTASPQFPRADT